MCSQRASLRAHVSTVEWVTWTDSRWCSLGTRCLIHPLSPLSKQSIIILLLCLIPQDHWGDSGPPFLCAIIYFWVGECQPARLWSFYPGSWRQLVDVNLRQGSMGHFLMMWFSDKPGKTGWLNISRCGRETKEEAHCGETAGGKQKWEGNWSSVLWTFKCILCSCFFVITKCMKESFPTNALFHYRPSTPFLFLKQIHLGADMLFVGFNCLQGLWPISVMQMF